MEFLLFCLFLGISGIYSLLGGSKNNETYCEPVMYPNNSTSLCCFINETGKCLPSFLIAGTQKSGTTALAVELSSHPLISFSIKKELHYFDRLDAYQKGITSYFEKFHFFKPFNLSDSVKELFLRSKLQMPLYAEATPFYIASRDACHRISETIPEVKLIVLLRNPVDRAYSEYQMKLRRVEKQNDFVRLVKVYSSAVFRCLRLHPLEIPLFSRCLPKDISEHSHYKRFLVSINELYLSEYKGNRANPRRTYTLIDDDRNAPEVIVLDDGDDPSDSHFNFTSKLQAWNRMIETCFQLIPEDAITHPHTPLNVSKLETLLPLQYTYDFFPISSPFDTFRYQSIYSTPSNSLSLNSTLKSKRVYFHPMACMGKNAKESIEQLHQVFQKEIDEINSCAGENFLSQPLEEIDRLIEKCIKVKHGISSQYLYRSMYAPQIYHCFKYLPHQNFLFLSSESLKGDQRYQTMMKIWNFLHIPPNPTSVLLQSEISSETQYVDWIQQSLNKIFPDFENNTGWRLQSTYSPLPDDIRQLIATFLEPLNQKLDLLIGEQLSAAWKRQLA